MDFVRSKNPSNSVFTALFVCEGENTEPAYLFEFEKYLNQNFKSIYPNEIKFSIIPLKLEIVELNSENQIFTRKKNFRKTENTEVKINELIEPEYKAAPTRWVRCAQKESEQANFDSVWAIFDYDNRNESDLKAAFELANNSGSRIKIAYSSYSFEYWLLLHYELYTNFLRNSECKDKNREIISCGESGNLHEKNCKGESCLGGYLRFKEYPVGHKIKTKSSTFNDLIELMNKARYRSAFIRNLPQNTGRELWQCKPITTVDVMVNEFLNLSNSLIWQFEEKITTKGGIEISWKKAESNIQVIVYNNTKTSFIVTPNSINLLNNEFEKFGLEKRIIVQVSNSSEAIRIDYENIGFEPTFISFEDRGIEYLSLIQQ